MKVEVWKFIWNEFCESQTHLDSLLSRIPDTYGPKIKGEVAVRFGPFLRRPWSISQALGIDLAENPEAFWNQSYIQLKKNTAVHQVLEKLSHHPGKLPTQGTTDDFPPEMVREWREDWGEEVAARLCALLSQDPLTIIRVKRNFISQAAEAFTKARPGRFSPRARVFKGYEPVLKSALYQEGGLEIQDEGSQVMAWFTLYPEIFKNCISSAPQIQKQSFEAPANLPGLPSLTVIDACAGAGGKTLALSDFLGGQGRIFAYDVYEKKIQALRRRVGHALETNIQAMHLTPEVLAELQSKFTNSADRVLIDSPCGGQGVLRRNPDIKWNRKPLPKAMDTGVSITELQQKVLQDYATLVKKGGRMVYGVCTFRKSESTAQVDWFIKKFPEFKLMESGFIGPYETDGFFMASFLRE